MGQNLFNTTLGQERAGYKTKAEMAQADAMRQIQESMYQQRMAQESARNAQLQQLAQALASAGGSTATGGLGPVAPVAPVIPGATVPTSIEQLLQQIAERQDAGTQSGSGSGIGANSGMYSYAI